MVACQCLKRQRGEVLLQIRRERMGLALCGGGTGEIMGVGDQG